VQPKIIKRKEILSNISMKEAIIQMEWAFKNIYKYSSIIPIRSHIEFSENSSTLIMPGFLSKNPYYIVKILNISSARTPSIVGTVNVFDFKSGKLIALMDAGSITQIRTGAVSGLATKYLSNKNSKYLCVFGTGVQALSQVEAVLEVRDISSIGVISTSYSKGCSFSKKIEKFFSIECQTLDFFDIPQNSIICTATTSQLPIFSDADLPFGCHINAIGSYKPFAREIPSNTVSRSKVIVDDLRSCSSEAGDLLIPEKEGNWSMEKIYCELGEMLLGSSSPRENNKEITLFKSVGHIIQDLAVVNYIMDRL
tara:strand:+ start:814 stop:1743 length:930 start_codon:yes stop_codon:yes gene_type:complete